MAGTVHPGRVLQLARHLTEEVRENEHGQRQPCRRVDEDQSEQGVPKAEAHDEAEDADRPQPDGDHDSDGEVKTQQPAPPESIARQGEGRHRTEDDHEDERRAGDDHAVAQPRRELAALADRVVADRVEGRRRRRQDGIAEDRVTGLERVHDHEHDREQRPALVE